jgi:hypothetical protein
VTTAEIQALADFDNSAAPDYPIGTVLRQNVIPDFFDRVGHVSWRQWAEVVTFGPGDRYRDISPYFSTIESVWLVEPRRQLKYAGDSSFDMLMSAFDNPEPAAPRQYFISSMQAPIYNPMAPTEAEIEGPVGPRRLTLHAPCDAVYKVSVFGWQIPWFADNSTAVNMDLFVPRQYQWGLVEGLRAEVFRERLGVENPKTVLATQGYLNVVERAKLYKNTTIEETARYA